MQTRWILAALAAVLLCISVPLSAPAQQHWKPPPNIKTGPPIGGLKVPDIDRGTKLEKLPEEAKPDQYDHGPHIHKTPPHFKTEKGSPPKEYPKERESSIKVMEWPFTNAQYPFHIQLRVFSNGWQVSPEVTLTERYERVLTFRCVRNQVLCYGAWDKEFKSWGVGQHGTAICGDNCCRTCTEGRVDGTRF